MRQALATSRLPRGAVVALAFVSDAEMRGLNVRHRGTDRITDVLSFGAAIPAGFRGAAVVDFLEPAADGSVELGDIVIAGDQAKRQAKRRGWSLAAEVAFLAAHGALHLVGYEDDTAAGYREMRRLGEDALAKARILVRRRASRERTETMTGS